MKNQRRILRYALAIGLIAIVAALCLVAKDFNDPATATAPNGEPVGAQHPRSEQP
jgi:hypothetical protein